MRYISTAADDTVYAVDFWDRVPNNADNVPSSEGFILTLWTSNGGKPLDGTCASFTTLSEEQLQGNNGSFKMFASVFDVHGALLTTMYLANARTPKAILGNFEGAIAEETKLHAHFCPFFSMWLRPCIVANQCNCFSHIPLYFTQEMNCNASKPCMKVPTGVTSFNFRLTANLNLIWCLMPPNRFFSIKINYMSLMHIQEQSLL
jgi:hypothetical protein